MGGALDPFKFPLAYDLQKVGVAVAGERERERERGQGNGVRDGNKAVFRCLVASQR